ncbi:unnamed protein product [Calypogeia fissa]
MPQKHVRDERDEPTFDGEKRSRSSKRKSPDTEQESEELFVEKFLAKLDVVAEADADLNRASKPAIEKLKMLPELLRVLGNQGPLQSALLDRGVLSSLKNWLEPLPDGSVPNLNIRSALLKLLTNYLPVDAEDPERRAQLKQSGLGKAVMFLSKLPEETPENKNLARDLVHKWSRTSVKPRGVDASGGRDEPEVEFNQVQRELKPGDRGYQYPRVTIPEADPHVFIVRPASKVNPWEVEAQRKALEKRYKKRTMRHKKLRQLALNKKSLQAVRLSVDGRGLSKIF